VQAGTISVTDNAGAGGSFVYQGTGADTATVNLTRDTTGTLDGSNNAEIIIGNGSGTTIVGNGGRDVIYGGLGSDTFDYNSTGDVVTVGAVTAANVGQLEVIRDFAAGDKIDLATIDARSGGFFTNDAFVFQGESSAAYTQGNTPATAGNNGANGGLHFFYVTDLGGQEYTVVEASNDGDAAAELQLALLGHINLTSGDFNL
jgi:Ca2+-binding RTX toxin-like protein